MQKKNYSPESSAAWKESMEKQQKKDMMTKLIMWGGIIIVSVIGLAALVFVANKSTDKTTKVENANLPAPKSTDIIVGDKNAKVVITEYADFQCPACASYSPVVNKILSDYPNKVKLVYRFFPLKSIHKNAQISGQAGYAAYKLGKFPEIKDSLYSNQVDWENLKDPREIFEGYAQTAGLDVTKFREIMNSDEAKKAVEAGENEAIGLGLNSTPSFFIGKNQVKPASYDDFKKLIDEELLKDKPLQ